MDSIFQFILRARFLILGVWALVLAMSLWALPSLRLDMSIIPLLEASEAEKKQVQHFDQTLPVVPMPIACVLAWEEPIGPSHLKQLASYGQGLSQVKGVRSVVSLASVRVVESADPIPVARRLMDLAESESVESIVRRHPLLQRQLISVDGRSSAVVVDHDDPNGGFEALADAARAHVPQGATLRLIGAPPVEKAMRETMTRDMAVNVGLESICYLILLSLFFRTVRGVVVPMLVVLSALVLYFGVIVFLGWSVSIIETAIPGLIIIIGLCDAIHMLHRFEEAWAEHGDRRMAVDAMMRGVAVACVFTSLTTAFGFLSLLVAPHAAVRDFAISATLGIAMAWLCVAWLMPALLLIWPMGRARSGRQRHWHLPMFGRPKWTVAMFAGLVLIASWGVSRVVVDSHWLEELPKQSETVQDLRWFEANFGGLLTIDVEIEGDLRDPNTIRAFEKLAARVNQEAGVSHHESYTQWVRELSGSSSEDSDALLKKGVRFMPLVGALFPHHLVTPQFDHGRMRFFTLDVGTKRYFQIKSLIEQEAAKLPKGVVAKVGGFGLMAHRSSRLVVTTMMRSFLLSAVVITLFVMIAYRSFRLGLMAIVPNVLPILVALGVTGWLGIELRIGIVMIYCIGIGLAVDDSIHILSRYVQERRLHPEATVTHALHRTMRSTGSALLITSVVLTVGSLCYLWSGFQSLRDVGILLSAVVVTALLADVYLLPLMIQRWMGGSINPDQKTTPGHPGSRQN